MKLSVATIALSMASASAFAPCHQSPRSSVHMNENGMDLTGNSWKPDSEKMGSTDVGDYFPDGYDAEEEIAFSSGMMGSQANLGRANDGPQLPGLENLGDDAMIAGGLEQDSDIPAGMEFVPSSVPDGSFEFNVASTGTGDVLTIAVKPVCMTFEDYYAGFAPGSHPSFSVSPAVGRMDRRGGEESMLDILCTPNGVGGELTGDLVINLPEDNSKICYKITVKSL